MQPCFNSVSGISPIGIVVFVKRAV